jgi:hypothetical protein
MVVCGLGRADLHHWRYAVRVSLIRPVPLLLAVYFLVLLAFQMLQHSYSTTPSDEALTLLLAPLSFALVKRIWVVRLWLAFAVYALLGIIGAILSPYRGVEQPLSVILDLILDIKLPAIFFGFYYILSREKDLDRNLREVCWVFVWLALMDVPFVLRDFLVNSGVGIHGQSLVMREGHYQPQGLYRHQVESAWRVYLGAFCAIHLYTLRKRSLTRLFVAALLCVTLFLHLSTKESICLVLFLILQVSGRKLSFGKILLGTIMSVVVVTLLAILTPLGHLVEAQFTQFLGADTYDTQARTMLVIQSFHIAGDFFPIGTGAGSYASLPSFKLGYSEVYYAYGISSIWGAGPEDPAFLMDVFWPKIVGQTGFFGVIFYSIFLWAILGSAVKLFFRDMRRYAWLVGGVVISTFIFSFAANPYTHEFMLVAIAFFAAYGRAVYMRNNQIHLMPASVT